MQNPTVRIAGVYFAQHRETPMRRSLYCVMIVFAFCVPLHAQWSKVPQPAIPRTADGKPNLSAPAPRTADGKPDLSGMWMPPGGYIRDLTKDIKDPVPFQPWAKAVYD